ncbi:hypothetical protein HMPREF1322_0074 [Porphyromonas gingivalis W50]|nr:hypothetical protein HMPREF1322_0074 [Porphyromonas gingivalis W50]
MGLFASLTDSARKGYTSVSLVTLFKRGRYRRSCFVVFFVSLAFFPYACAITDKFIVCIYAY